MDKVEFRNKWMGLHLNNTEQSELCALNTCMYVSRFVIRQIDLRQHMYAQFDLKSIGKCLHWTLSRK